MQRKLSWLALVCGVLMLLAGAAGVILWARGDTIDTTDWLSLATTVLILTGAGIFIRQGYHGIRHGKPFTNAFLLASMALSITLTVLVRL